MALQHTSGALGVLTDTAELCSWVWLVGAVDDEAMALAPAVSTSASCQSIAGSM